MLEIRVGATELYDEEKQEFVSEGGTVVRLEHSLVSVSKWEETFEKPFLDTKDKTEVEVRSYVQMMVLGESPKDFLSQLSESNIEAINSYIAAKRTATWFADSPGAPKSREIITSELIYYWMTVFSIPFECQYWHLNRLFTFIRVCNEKQSPPKKMSKAETARRNAELNRQRREKFKTTG